MNLIAILYVLAAGAPFGSAANLAPFAPFGARGVFSGASVVFFAFVGFDAVATVAEEVPLPHHCFLLAPAHMQKSGVGSQKDSAEGALCSACHPVAEACERC